MLARSAAIWLLIHSTVAESGSGCPVCTCQSPTIWPVSGCNVKCGAKCGETCCCISGEGSCNSTRSKKTVPKFVINLDAAPEERFAAVAAQHKTYYGVLAEALKLMFTGDKYDKFLDAVNLSSESRQELQGVATALGQDFKTVMLGEYYYELDFLADASEKASWPEEWKAGPGCSGLIAQSADGTVYHGRNMDYPPPFSPMEYWGMFTKGGKVIFQGTTFAGTISMGGTCMVDRGFSVEINARGAQGRCCTPPYDSFIADAKAGKPSASHLVRQACSRGGDWDSAVKFLSETPVLGGPNYYIVAGAAPGEGAVIARNATGVDSVVQRLSDGYPKEKPWYLYEANFDQWDNSTYPAPVGAFYYGNDLRRESAHMLMSKLSPESFNLDTLWNVMSDDGGTTIGPMPDWGVYNFATINTCLMVPSQGIYYSYEGHEVVMKTAVV